jgi:hypothetical protein
MRASQLVTLATAGVFVTGSFACGGRENSAARTTALPMSPSVGFGFEVPSFGTGQLGTQALRPFPGRELAFQFRSVDLEQLYRGQLGRPAFATNVNPEGSVIWVSEYLRYRVAQCSPDESLNRIVTQISGGGVPSVCGQTEQPFPGREEALVFRRQLETIYRNRNAPSADTHVNDEGDVIWTMEYLRYVLSGCSQSVTISKITDQINGRGVPADCSSGGGGGGGTPDPVADFSVTPNDLKVANAGQCVTESAAPNNIMRCTFDGRISTPSSGLTYDWDFFGVRTFQNAPFLQNETIPCGNFGNTAANTSRSIKLTVRRTSDGKTSTKTMDVTFVKPTFC